MAIGVADNLAKFEWENEIPFNEDIVKKTIHAMIGEENPKVLGLLNYNTNNTKWGVSSLNPESNDVFGSYGFGQVNSAFAITVKKVSEETTDLKIVVSSRQGGWLSGNQAFLQSECEKFNKALVYYLQHQDEVNAWETTVKPNSISSAKKSGCAVFIPLFLIGGAGLLSIVLF